MRTTDVRSRRLALCATALLAVTVVNGQAQVVAAPPALLAGCWEARDGDTLIQEQWTAPLGGQMLEMGRTLRGAGVLGWEHMLIEVSASGLDFVATPSGKTTTRFVLVRHTASMLEFSNPAHGFPGTVGYTLAAPDELFAQIAGSVVTQAGAKDRTIDFNYRRTACP